DRRQPVGRRTAPRGDRACAGRAAAPDPARRTVRGRRSDLGRRDPAHRRASQAPRHRRADHRPQRARDLGHLRPGVYPQRRGCARAGGSGHAPRQSRRAPGLPRGILPPVAVHVVQGIPRTMKPRLQTSLGQQLVLTPQLRQALHLLQLPVIELEAEIAAAVESNPLLDWVEDAAPAATDDKDEAPAGTGLESAPAAGDDAGEQESAIDWPDSGSFEYSAGSGRGGEGDEGDAASRMAQSETLHDHLAWQLHLSHLSPRDVRIGAVLIDAIDDDGYLRAPFAEIVAAMHPEPAPGDDEILAVLRQIQRFDPVGVGA